MSMVGVGKGPKKADVGRIRKMSKDEQPKPPATPPAEDDGGFPSWMRPFREWSGRESGLPGLIFGPQRAANQALSSAERGIGSFLSGIPATTATSFVKARAESPTREPLGAEQPQMSFEEYASMFGGGSRGGGGGRPDLSAYRAALTNQANQINAQIQAMYRALGEEAAANLGRIQDVYGGAQTGVGDVYNSATQNVQQAFGSAQQQAADQLARLGIEAAAPTVIDPMALSQAEAVAGLEQGRAGGLSALGRYGTTAQDFASQMAQVAQQQGTEMNAAILASLQNRLMDTLAAEQSGGGGGGGGGLSVRDQIALREQYNQEVLGQLPIEERRLAFEMAESAARPLNDWVEQSVRRYMEAQFPRGARVDPTEYWAAEAAARQEARRQVGLE